MRQYAGRMKRRITLNLSEDVVALLEELPGSASSVAEAALRDGLRRQAHQRALLEWLDELDEACGTQPDPDAEEAVERLWQMIEDGTASLDGSGEDLVEVVRRERLEREAAGAARPADAA